MKSKNLSKKLKLNKKTIAQLNHIEMKSLHGEGTGESVDYCKITEPLTRCVTICAGTYCGTICNSNPCC